MATALVLVLQVREPGPPRPHWPQKQDDCSESPARLVERKAPASPLGLVTGLAPPAHLEGAEARLGSMLSSERRCLNGVRPFLDLDGDVGPHLPPAASGAAVLPRVFHPRFI